MTSKDKFEDQDESGSTGSSGSTGGSSGNIGFRDFIGTGGLDRDDLLSSPEKKRLLSVHKDTHELRVKKQKETREIRKALKEGKIPLQVYRQGLGLGGGEGIRSLYKANPVLKDKAQFSGIDRQENMLPTENMAATNEEKREDRLENRLQNRLSNTPKPGFNPRPQYR